MKASVILLLVTLLIGAHAHGSHRDVSRESEWGDGYPSCYRLSHGGWIDLDEASPSNDGHIYRVIREPKNFADAQTFCRSIGGHLAMEKTNETKEYIHDMFADGGFSFWVGANFALNEWIDGSPIEKEYWNTSRPAVPQCATCESDINGWIDTPCTETKSFICQKKKNIACIPQLGFNCEDDGTFSPQQCNGEASYSICWCVHSDGKKIPDSKHSHQKPMNCTVARAKKSVCLTKASAGGALSVTCMPNGDFHPVQCYGKLCWCSMPDGIIIPKSFFERNPQENVNPSKVSECWRHRVFTYDCKGKVGNFVHPFGNLDHLFLSCETSMANVCSCQWDLLFSPDEKVCIHQSTYFADKFSVD